MKSTLENLKRIKVDALYGKKKHFNAADRVQGYHYWLGIPLILINILTGSVLLYVLTEGSTDWVKYVPLGLALLAALLGGLQTFFNFSKKVDAHRRLGNRYLAIMKRCDRINGYVNDEVIQKNDLILQVEEIAGAIDNINQDAEAFPTSAADFEKSREGVQDGEENYTKSELEL
ncbi:SLATT domain-containing protein [Thermodesulfobacteriota bacterium]